MMAASRWSTLAIALFVGLAASSPASAEVQGTDRVADSTAKVPALDSFHEVIFKIWHDAWPNKDTATLKKLAPEVERGISGVASAALPGILREKKTEWEAGVARLQALGAEYKSAAGGEDAAELLAAAEKLHSQYEALVRIIRPALREIDDFHSSLYLLYHYYLPSFQVDMIRRSAEELKLKVEALNRARLPDRLKAKEQDFAAARAKLSKSVEAFAAVAPSGDRSKIQDAVTTVHSDYESLNSIFE